MTTVVRGNLAVASAAAPAPARAQWSGSRDAQPESPRERCLRPVVPVRELVTLTRDPDSGSYL
ncbi:hypothetical protein ACFWWS_37845, partial [Streptomyces sp. NPDC059083]|uniref:hypothetical protein n=1 Tax=Streptomyces sp. NPDC059083 TaxID=3346721 RepID=UPI0036C06284